MGEKTCDLIMGFSVYIHDVIIYLHINERGGCPHKDQNRHGSVWTATLTLSRDGEGKEVQRHNRQPLLLARAGLR